MPLQNIKNIVPILETFRAYSKAKLGADLVGGITVATLLVPQGLAYAVLAGVPPIYGLYTAIIPLIIYAILGSSRHLSIGPVAISSLLVLSGVSSIAEPGSSEYLSLVITAGFLIGICQWVIGLVKLGFVVNFISYPVISGFTSAAAIIIVSTQLKDALGMDVSGLESVFERFTYAVTNIGEANLFAASLSIGTIAIILLSKRIHESIPGPLIVIVTGVLLVYFLGLTEKGVRIIGEVPSGLPSFSVPSINIDMVKALFPTVLTVTLMGIVESISIAKVLQSKAGDYDIKIDQELAALGVSKIIGSFFQAIPSSGSFSRSAINISAGSKTQVSSLVAAFFVGISLLFLTPLFYYLPYAVLAGLILVSVVSLFDIKEAIHLWKTHRSDFIMMVVTFLLTLILGIEEGVLIGVVLSIVTVLLKSSKPHIAVLGRIPNTDDFRNIKRFEDAIECDEVAIIRFDEQLYFANAGYFKDKLTRILADKKYLCLKHLLLDASHIHEIDSTGIKTLLEIEKQLSRRGIELHFCNVNGPVRDRLYSNELLVKIDRHHMSISSAIAELVEGKMPQAKRVSPMQSNYKK